MIHIGNRYKHKTLGPVEVLEITNSIEESVYVKVLTGWAQGEWTSDTGDTFDNAMGHEWWVNEENLTPFHEQLPKEDRVKLKLKTLWNNSNWVTSGKGTQIA